MNANQELLQKLRWQHAPQGPEKLSSRFRQLLPLSQQQRIRSRSSKILRRLRMGEDDLPAPAVPEPGPSSHTPTRMVQDLSAAGRFHQTWVVSQMGS